MFLAFLVTWLALLQSGFTLPSVTSRRPIYGRIDFSTSSTLPSCNGPCITNTENCQIEKGFCYIEGRCYENNQTRSNVSNSCLQCQSENVDNNWSFNSQCSANDQCQSDSFYVPNLCKPSVIAAFYNDSGDAITRFYNFEVCSVNRDQCQSGFFRSVYDNKTYACCPGSFCPEGQICMIPCRTGAYCPSPLTPNNGTCRSPVRCPENLATEYGTFGCGGSTIEGFCPNGYHCPTPAEMFPCPNTTKYCPTGVNTTLDCPSGFVCLLGRARRTRIITLVMILVIVILVVFVALAFLWQWLVLTRKVFGQYELRNPNDVSDYFKKPQDANKRRKRYIELNIHLERAKLKNVTRFDPKKNRGFTGRITAGKLTALMGGSGCGKSSLLETIHGRRPLRKNGSITFAHYEPLSNRLTDYLGYVPQADIMHNDLTVFETVYYSARARRLNDKKEQIIADVCFVLQKLGLSLMHNSFTKTLSGGESLDLETRFTPKPLLDLTRSTKTSQCGYGSGGLSKSITIG